MDGLRPSHEKRVTVIGAGLAGSEAAWQIARAGVPVVLHEMRPVKQTPAHQTPAFAELVCSNSLGSDAPHSASRILKDELARLDAFVLAIARRHQVPAGASLAVDRNEFSAAITQALESHPLVEIRREEVGEIPGEGIVVVATGPLTTPSLAESLRTLVGEASLYFYDAISPIVSTESLDLDRMYYANRWDKGETKDFLNIPLDRAQYEALVDDLLSGEVVLPHDFEEEKYFEGCMPIEAIAARGRQTLAFGPMRPVGLVDPRTGKRPYAVVQLRAENKFLTAYNLVGFQTKLKYKEQERVFRKLPGLESAEFLRLGCMHRNTYLHSPRLLAPTLQLRAHPRLFVAGQLTGTEGYLESSATGLVAGQNAARLALGAEPYRLPSDTMLGALLGAISDPAREAFQPMNANMGILPPLPPPEPPKKKRDKQSRNAGLALRSQARMEAWLEGARSGAAAHSP